MRWIPGEILDARASSLEHDGKIVSRYAGSSCHVAVDGGHIHAAAFRHEQSRDRLWAEGSGEKVSLPEVAPRLQTGRVASSLDPFGHRFKVKRLAQLDDRENDRRLLRPVAQLATND